MFACMKIIGDQDHMKKSVDSIAFDDIIFITRLHDAINNHFT